MLEENKLHDKLSLNCSGTERRGGGGGGTGGNAKRRGGSAKREGVFICDGRKGGRTWTVPEQSEGVYGGGRGGGGGKECTCDNGGSRRGGNRASSDFLFVCAKERAVAGGSETCV